MGDKAFVDTNMLLRAFYDTFPEHKTCRALFDRLVSEDYELWISRQVIREYLVQTTHPRTFSTQLSLETVTGQLNNITSICYVADETDIVTTNLLGLLKDYPTAGKQVHDANIVATMLAYDINTLLTLNIDDFKRFEDKITLISP
jgi:predicted nucleic acid-binding protein